MKKASYNPRQWHDSDDDIGVSDMLNGTAFYSCNHSCLLFVSVLLIPGENWDIDIIFFMISWCDWENIFVFT